jgi:hypothetical protein
MRTDRRMLLAVLAEPEQLLRLRGTERDLVLRQLRRVKLLARVALQLRDRGLSAQLPQLIQDQLDSTLQTAQARQRLARWELDCLARALRPGVDHPVIVLKGCAYLLLDLPNAAGRMLTDVDLMVSRDLLAQVEAVLRGVGWESAPLPEYDEHYYREWAHEIPPLRHVEREMEVDIHHNIVMRTARLKPSAAQLLQMAVPIGGTGWSALGPVDMVLHAMTHLFCSSEQDDALRELVDIDALLRHFAALDSGFWEALVTRARAQDLQRPAWYALRYCSQWLGTPVPSSAMGAIDAARPMQPARLLMDRLMPGALFASDPDGPDRAAGLARTLLLVRSHWIRMPPAILVAHLTRKTWRRLTQDGGGK